MKRLTYLIAALLIVLCSACEDESGEYVEQMFTNTDLNNAVRSCLTVSKDTAISHLCALNGFSEEESYQMKISEMPNLKTIKDTLAAYGESDLVDTLLARINTTCLNMGTYLGTQCSAQITALTCAKPSELIKGKSNAITEYFRSNCNTALESSLTSALSVQLNASGAAPLCDNILRRYIEITQSYVSVDLQRQVMQHLLTAFYSEMEKEEALVRTDETHRTNTILKNVFGN